MDEIKNYILEEIKQNESISRKHKNHIEHVLILGSTITGGISISVFASLLGIPIGIIIYAVRLKFFAIAAGIKKKKKIIMKKNKMKHNKIALFAKTKLGSIEVLISEALIDSSISHDEFILINNVLKEYDDMKEEIKSLKN